MKPTLFVIPFGLPLRWSADYEYQTCAELAKIHPTIAFLSNEGISVRKMVCKPKPILHKDKRGVYLFRPLYLLPFQRFKYIKCINFQIALLQLQIIILCIALYNRCCAKVFWTYSLQYNILPTHFSKNWIKIYDCIDTSKTNDSKTSQFQQKKETAIIKNSDIVFTNSQTLYKVISSKHTNIIKTGEGLFTLSVFSSYSKIIPNPSFLHIPKPRIVFIGNINTRLDFTFISSLANITKDFSYVFIGQVDTKYDGPKKINILKELGKLKKLPNIHILPQIPKHFVPAYIQHSDIGFIPYDIKQEFNQHCNPMKIQEYFYLKKPVLCTPIPEAIAIKPYITIARSANEAKKKLINLTSSHWPKQYQDRQRSLAIKNSIESKVSFVLDTLVKQYPEIF